MFDNSIGMTATYEVKSLDGFQAIQQFNRHKMELLWLNTNATNALSPGEKKKLNSLYKNKKAGTLKGNTPITYKLKNKEGELGYGRYYGSIGSLETLQRDVRATLCFDFYWDIDIVNCHPNLAYQMATQYDVDMPMLQSYCENRKKYVDYLYQTYSVSEADAKGLVIELINGGKLKAKGDDGSYIYPVEVHQDFFVKQIIKEVDKLYMALVASNQHTELLNHLQKQDRNVKGSFLANIYQREERKCLDVIVAVLQQMGYKIDVLAYDGCMALKEGVGLEEPSTEVLTEVERAVKEHTGYDIKLKVKPMDDEVIPLEELVQQKDDDGYDEMKKLWERTHYYFKPTGTIVEETEEGKRTHFNITHASEAFNMWKLKKINPQTGHPVQFLSEWRYDDKRRIIEEVVYKMPEDCKPNEASVFKGFGYKRINEEVSEEEKVTYIKTFKMLMERIVGEETSPEYQALLKCFAHRIQKPFERPDVCIILSSKGHGVGKETIVNILSDVIGKNTAHYTSDEIFWDKHDTTKEGALLIHLEEAGMANKKMADTLKARITSEVQIIRPCGISGYEVPNRALYIMTTNRDCPVKIEESDRRFFIINIPEYDYGAGSEDEIRERKLNFWNEVYSVIKKPGFIKTIGEFLEAMDLTGFLPRNFPITDYKRALMQTSTSPEVLFLEEWTHSGEGDYIETMYQQYTSFCIQRSLPHKQSSISFAIAIARETKYYTKKRVRKNEVDRTVYVKK